MPVFHVELEQRMTASMSVEADTAEQAADIVHRQDYPLPPRTEWTAHKSGAITVYERGEEVYGIDF